MIGLQDYPAVKNQPEVTPAELDRPASFGEIHWCEKDCFPPDLRVRPSHLVVKGGKVRAVHHWSNRKYGSNEESLNPPAKYGDMRDFLQMLPPGAIMGGVDFQDVGVFWAFWVFRGGSESSVPSPWPWAVAGLD